LSSEIEATADSAVSWTERRPGVCYHSNPICCHSNTGVKS